MIDWKKHSGLQKALHGYLLEHGLTLTGYEVYSTGIDCVFVYVEGDLVFIIGLPPVTDYDIEETEHTDKYFRMSVAV